MPVKSLPKKLLLANLAFLFVNLIWGAASPIIKYTLEYIPPFTFLFLRLLLVCILMLPYTIYKLTEVKINKKDYLNFLLLGLFSQSALAIIFVAMKYTTALDATVISVITGALTIYAGHYFYKDKVNRALEYGVVLTIIGTFVVVIEPLITGNVNHVPIYERVIGNALALIYNVTWVIYVLWSKMATTEERPKILKKTLDFINIKSMSKVYPPTLVVVITMYVGLLTTIPLALLENTIFLNDISFNIMSIDFRGILGLLYMTLFSSIAAFTLYQWALNNGRVSDSAIFGYLGPVFSFPVAFWLLGEVPSKTLIIGAIIIAAGVVIAEISAHRMQKQR